MKEYVGGCGLVVWYLFDEMDFKVDLLSFDNKLIFVIGLLMGIFVFCGVCYMVVMKGVLIDVIMIFNLGGYWGFELKFVGYDMVILEGKLLILVYLFIYDDYVELCFVELVWGKIVLEIEDGLCIELGMF